MPFSFQLVSICHSELRSNSYFWNKGRKLLFQKHYVVLN